MKELQVKVMRATWVYFWLNCITCFNLIIQFLKAFCYRDQRLLTIFLQYGHKLYRKILLG